MALFQTNSTFPHYCKIILNNFDLCNADCLIKIMGKLFYIFLLDQGPFCGATDYPYFGNPVGFKDRVVLSPALILSCMQWT